MAPTPVEDSVAAAAALVDAETGGRLDVLVNNAGIAGARKPAGEVTANDARSVFETHVLGVVRITHAFVALLERSDSPVIVNVSSGMASIAVTTDRERFESTQIGIAYPGLEGGCEHAHDAGWSHGDPGDGRGGIHRLAHSL